MSSTGPGSRGRRLLARLLPLLALGAVAAWYFHSAPRSTELVWDLSGKRQGLERLEVEIRSRPNSTLIRHLEMSYSPRAPAPEHQLESLSLARGEYVAQIFLRYADHEERLERTFAFRDEDSIVVRLE